MSKQRRIMLKGWQVKALREHRLSEIRTDPSSIFEQFATSDQLWVAETWAPLGDHGVIYRAGPQSSTHGYTHVIQNRGRWSSSASMSRDLSRFTLRVLDVRPEQLQDIDDAGALASGIEGEIGGVVCPACEGSGDFEDDPDPGCLNCGSSGRVCRPRDLFAEQWDKDHKHQPWESNPAVRVLRVEKI